MTLERFQTKDRKSIDIPQLQQFISDIDPQYHEDPHFIVREISLHIANILLYRENLGKPNKKQELLDTLNLDVLGSMEQQLFDERRKLVNVYLGQKMFDIKAKADDEYLQFFDFMKDKVDSVITKKGFPKEIVLQETKRLFLLITQDLINMIKDEYYALTHLSSLERQKVIDTLLEKYPTVSKSIMHRVRHTMNNDQNMINYVNNELVWIGQLFLENMPENNSFIEYLNRVCDLWDDTIDVKTLHIQYQEYMVDYYSQEIEKSLLRKENDRKGPIKKADTKQPSTGSTPKNQVIQRYNPEVQLFINHFFPEQFFLHKDLQRIYRNNKFFYKDDLANRLNIPSLSPEMERFCEENGIIVTERQKEIIPVTLSESNEHIVENKIVSPSSTIESRLSNISVLSLENRVGEYLGLFKELGYAFTKEEEFAQRTLEMCRSNMAIEKSIKKLLKDRSNGIEEIKKTGRDFYTFQLHNACRIVLPRKGEILGIGSHDRYETLLKNNF